MLPHLRRQYGKITLHFVSMHMQQTPTAGSTRKNDPNTEPELDDGCPH